MQSNSNKIPEVSHAIMDQFVVALFQGERILPDVLTLELLLKKDLKNE